MSTILHDNAVPRCIFSRIKSWNKAFWTLRLTVWLKMSENIWVKSWWAHFGLIMSFNSELKADNKVDIIISHARGNVWKVKTCQKLKRRNLRNKVSPSENRPTGVCHDPNLFMVYIISEYKIRGYVVQAYWVQCALRVYRSTTYSLVTYWFCAEWVTAWNWGVNELMYGKYLVFAILTFYYDVSDNICMTYFKK